MINNFIPFDFRHQKHTDPDYSCVYVTIHTAEGTRGYGLTFTLGKVCNFRSFGDCLYYHVWTFICRSRDGYRPYGCQGDEAIRWEPHYGEHLCGFREILARNNERFTTEMGEMILLLNIFITFNKASLNFRLVLKKVLPISQWQRLSTLCGICGARFGVFLYGDYWLKWNRR